MNTRRMVLEAMLSEHRSRVLEDVRRLKEGVPVQGEEPIRLKFGGKGPGEKQKITKQDVVDLKADQQVSSLDGRAYDGNRRTGQLTLQGGSDRVLRRQQGVSARQWKKLRKAARRSSAPTDDLGNPEPHDLGERDLGEHGE